jgi:ribonuclease VapC
LIVVDTSVIIAIVFREPERQLFYDKILDDGSAHISAVSYMEAGMVLTSRLGDAGEQVLDQILHKTNISVTPVSPSQAKVALEAFRRYGKGRHPAGLNFGDCFSYALAKSTGQPLLFKGLDFAKTDIVSA